MRVRPKMRRFLAAVARAGADVFEGQPKTGPASFGDLLKTYCPDTAATSVFVRERVMRSPS